jgi:hypothetical protein
MTAVLNDNKFIKQEEEFLADVDVDYVSLHDMVRIFAGFYRHPTEKDYLQALEFSIGPGDPINKSHEEVISWLKEMWYAGKYKEIDYGVWFDLELEG